MEDKPHGIMKKQEGEGSKKGGKTLFKEADRERQRSVEKGRTKDPRMSVISSSRRDSGVEARGLSSFSRAGGSWETDWNAMANVRDRARTTPPATSASAPVTSIGGQKAAAAGGRPGGGSGGGRGGPGTSPMDSRFTMIGGHLVQMEESGRDSTTLEDTDPDELLRWTTAARERDVNRQVLLDHRRKLHLDDFDPNHHRVDIVLISDFEALAITFNVFMGTAFLGLPVGYVNSGLLLGTIGIFLVAVSVSYCMHTLIYWRYEISKRLRQSWLGYPKAIEFALQQGPAWLAALAPAFKVFLHILFMPYFVFATSCQCVTAGITLRMVLAYYDVHEDIRTCIAIFIIPCVPLSIIPNLKLMAIASVVAVAASFVACFLLVVGIMIMQKDHAIGGNLVNVKMEAPFYLLVALSVLQPLAQVMCVESHMRNRERFLGYFGILNRAIIVVTATYLLLASIAYSKYDENTKYNILENLKMTDLEVATYIIYIISVILTFPMNVYTVYDFAWEVYLRSRLHGFPQIEKMLWGYTLRIFVALFALIIAIIITSFLQVKVYIMAICLPLLILIFPSVIEMVMGSPTAALGLKSYKFWIDLVVVLAGVYIIVASIYAVVITKTMIV